MTLPLEGLLVVSLEQAVAAPQCTCRLADAGARVWSFGEIPVVRGSFLESRIAPDFTVPDRKGRPVRLSQFRGKKVLLVTWASW